MSTQETMARERWATEEAFVRGNVNALDEVFAPDCTFHIPPVLHSSSLEEFKQYALANKQNMSNVRWSWDEIIIEGNSAVQRYTVRGNHTGTNSSTPVPPTGKELVIEGCAVYHLENGKIIEFIEYTDFLGLFQQIGAVQSTGQKQV
jgi:predicted ester cyclase